MKRTMVVLILIVVVVTTTATEAKTRTYANGWIRVTTRRSPSYRYGGNYSGNYGGYNHYNHYNRYSHKSLEFHDEKEGLSVSSGDFLTSVLGGGHKMVSETIAISREAREVPKLSVQEMSRWARRIKTSQQKKQQDQEEKKEEEKNVQKLEEEIKKLELELKKLELQKKLEEAKKQHPSK